MKSRTLIKHITVALILCCAWGCKLFKEPIRVENKSVPASYNNNAQDTANTSDIKWRNYFTDPNLIALIDTALKNNQELNITLREIEVARNEVKARKGEYLPYLGLNASAGIDKAGKYTWNGLSEEDLKANP